MSLLLVCRPFIWLVSDSPSSLFSRVDPSIRENFTIYIYIWEEKKESMEILIFRADDESAMRQSKLDGGLKISV